jgi:hypothetical protein
MLHEAAHVELLGQEFAATAMMLFMNEVARTVPKDAKYDPEDLTRRLLPLVRFARVTDESLADLLALKEIGSDTNARKRYQALVQELETVSASRNTTLKMLCEYLDAGGDADRLLVARAVATHAQLTLKEPERARAKLSKYDSTNEWTVATRIVEAQFRDFARTATELAHDVAPNESALQNPWTFERQVHDTYERLLKQLRSQMRD